MRNEFPLLIVLLSILILAGCKDRTNKISFESLLREMTDREELTRFPDYILKQASSYDRTQTGPEDRNTWFNNKDYGHYIRKEIIGDRIEYVIMEDTGPGCIVRWWIPIEYTYRNRTVRIYLDGNPEPVIQENYHELISGQSFVKEPFAFISSDEKDSVYQWGLPVGHPKQMGADLYLPIPYSESCKITLDDNPFFYVINYRSYDPGVRVESFSKKAFDAEEKTLMSTAKTLADHENHHYDINKDQIIQPGTSVSLDLPPGENTVRSIRLKIDPDLPIEALRGMVVKMKFDDKETVWCPVSEFFGGGVYNRQLKDWNNSVGDSGTMRCNWLMPYQEEARIELINYWTKPVNFDLGVSIRPYQWDQKSLYFHANWHEQAPIRTNSPIDWNYISIEGKGVYAGDVLTVHSFSKGWWGEGDEKIYIDGEKDPSQLGTGLEDYYGYAWGMAHHYSSPFISMPRRDARGKGDWRGYTTISRMRLLDGIPFLNSLKVDVEAWVHDTTVSFSVATFWYGSKDASCNRIHEEDAVARDLPDFTAESHEELPGRQYPDPALSGVIEALGNGSVKQAGNHLDLLGWYDPGVSKTLDADQDNRYGTAGYYFMAARRLDARLLSVLTDSMNNPPEFIASFQTSGEEHASFQNTWFEHPEIPDNYLISGVHELTCGVNDEKGTIYFVMNEKVPEAFRMGIMLDNLDQFMPPGRLLCLSSSNKGNSGKIPLISSNRIPDWYFFDICDLRPGDSISISARCELPGYNTLSIGGLVFDVFGGSTDR